MADPINKAALENFKKQLAMQTLAYAQNAANAANMSAYSGQVGEKTGAGGPLDISNVPMVAGLANRLAVGQTGAGVDYKAGVNRLTGMPQYIEGRRQYMRWRYPSRYGLSGGGQTYSIPTLNIYGMPSELPGITTPPKQGS